MYFLLAFACGLLAIGGNCFLGMSGFSGSAKGFVTTGVRTITPGIFLHLALTGIVIISLFLAVVGFICKAV